MSYFNKIVLTVSLGLSASQIMAAELASYFNDYAALAHYNLESKKSTLNNADPKKKTNLLTYQLNKELSNEQHSKLTLMSEVNQDKQQFLKFQQSYRGFNVWNHQLIIMLDEKGNIAQSYGSFIKGIEKDLAQLPAVSEANKTHKLAEFIEKNYNDEDRIFKNKSVEVVVYLDKRNTAHLAYKFSFFTDVIHNNSKPEKVLAFVDVKNDAVLDKFDILNRATIEGGSGPSGNRKNVKDDYHESGYESYPPSTFVVRKENNVCYFATSDTDSTDIFMVETRDYQGATTLVNKAFSYDCLYSNRNEYKTINTAKSPLNDAHYYGQITSLMYQEYLNQKPFHNKAIVQNVHYGKNMDQAFYERGEIYYGDGDFIFYPMVALDVVAHEIAHGFTAEYGTGSEKLMATGQARAINEAFSDMSGAAAEFYLSGENDWQSNFESYRPSGQALRYFDEPTKDGESIDHVKDYETYTGAHYGAGVFNKAFHRLVTLEFNAEQNEPSPWNTKYAFIAFAKANQNCWSGNSSYKEAADCVLQQAGVINDQLMRDGITKADGGSRWSTTELQNHIRKAFSHVGINLAVGVGLESDFSQTMRFLDYDFINLSRYNGSRVADDTNYSWNWDFGDESLGSILSNPTHSFGKPGSYNVSLIVTGPNSEQDNYSVPIKVTDDYCSITSSNFDEFYISSVTINGVAKPSDASSYTDFSADFFSIKDGGNATVTITAGEVATSSDIPKHFKMWVDENDDGLFHKNDELVIDATDTSSVTQRISLSGGINDIFRARVMVSFDFVKTACGQFHFGEVEDYSLAFSDGPTPPVIIVTTQKNIDNQITFSNSTNDDRIQSWDWNFGDNSLTDHNKSPVHKYSQSGAYDVSVIAYDGNKQQIADWSQTVRFTTTTTPLFEPDINDKIITVNVGQSIMPKDSVVEWDFGDGTTNKQNSATHIYQNDGTYTVSLTITNNDNPNGKSVSKDVTIGAVEYAPQFDYNVTELPDGRYEVEFDNASVVPKDLHNNTKAHLTWTFGDGFYKTARNTNFDDDTKHIYDNGGTYQASLEIEYRIGWWMFKVVKSTIEVKLVPAAPVEYCQAKGVTEFEHINKVTFAGASFTTGSNQTSSVINPDQVIILTVGQEIAYTIEAGYPTEEKHAENYHVWIDLNGDGQFGDGDWNNDKSELLIQDFDHTSDLNGSGSVRGILNLPSEKIQTGTTRSRMRIIQFHSSSRTGHINPCSDYTGTVTSGGGEIEDYLVDIVKY